MPEQGPRRVPLATGGTALRGIVIGALGGGVVGVTSAYVSGARHGLDPTFVAVAAFFGLFGLVYTLVMVLGIVRSRASDITFGEDGFEIVGGPSSGLRMPWPSIDPTQVRQTERELIVSGRAIVESEDSEEKLGIRAIAQTIIAASSPKLPDPPRPEVGVVRCPSCGAEAVPTDASDVACRKCDGRVAIPAAVRARIRAGRELASEDRAIQRLAARLSRYPSAPRVNALIGAAAVTFMGGVALVSFGLARGLPAWVLAAIAPSLLFVTLARLDVADRAGAVALASGSSARAPESEGDPYTCRMCGAPLPDAALGALVVRCAYCDASNVLGLDLRLDAGSARWQAGSFATALAHRRRGEIWRAAAAVTAAVLLLAAWRLRTVRGGETADPDDCLLGSDDDCVAFCEHAAPYSCVNAIQSIVRKHDYARVVRVWTKQCEKDREVLACSAVADALSAGGHVPRDDAEAVRFAALACEAGAPDDCDWAGAMLMRGEEVPKDEAKAHELFKRGCAIASLGCGCTNGSGEVCDVALRREEPSEFRSK